MTSFLLDTNVISEVVRPRPDPKVIQWVDVADPDTLYVSVLTIGEIRAGIASLANGARRTRLEVWLTKDLAQWFAGRMLIVDAEIADRWGRMRAQYISAGLILPVVDGLLAATALQHNLILVTRNTRHVSATGVPVFNPWS